MVNGDLQTAYMLERGTPIPAGADLKSDTYTVPGNYYCTTNDTANTLINCPVYQAFTLKVEKGNGTDYPKQTFREYSSQKIVVRTFNQYDNTWTDSVSYIRSSDLGGAVFSTATGAIKYGMNGIYLGKFSNGVEQPDGTGIFDACIYLIGTKLLETAVYAFPITQYIGGHLFFNRMGTNNQFELTSWKKLI